MDHTNKYLMIVSVSPASSRWLVYLGFEPVSGLDETQAYGSFIALHDVGAGISPDAASELLARVRPSLIVGLKHDLSLFETLVPGELALRRLAGDVAEFDPRTFRQAMEIGLEIGRRAGQFNQARFNQTRFNQALAAVGRLEKDLWEAERTADASREPALRAVVVSDVKPIRLMGRWAPEVLKKAGFSVVGTQEGEDDLLVSIDELQSLAPDVVVLAMNGFDITRDAIDTKLREVGLDQAEVFAPRRRVGLRNPAFLREPGPELVRMVRQLLAFRQQYQHPADL